jgi:hypothetical protein
VKQRIVTPGGNETLMFSVDLSTYTGDTNFIGNHTQTGNTTITGVTSLGTGLIYNNTNTSGTQNFLSTYTGNYADESVVNFGGDFNRLSTSEQVYTA